LSFGVLKANGEEWTITYNAQTDSIYTITFRTLQENPDAVEVTGMDYTNGGIFEDAYNILDEVRIPSSITIDDKSYTVTQISADFNNHSVYYQGTKKLIIPSTFTKILGKIGAVLLESVIIEDAPITEFGGKDLYDQDVFSGCENLKTVSFGNKCTFTEIGLKAFYRCVSLEEIKLPESVKTIGREAFSYSGIKSITLPSSIEEIQLLAFQNCESLETVACPDEMQNNITVDGDIFKNCSSLREVKLPSVNEIAGDMFRDCHSLVSLTIGANSFSFGDNRGGIGSHAFENCYNLTELNIPTQYSIIDEKAFFNCKSLKSINIPPHLDWLSGSAFAGCESLEEYNVVSSAGETVGGVNYSKDGVLLIDYWGEFSHLVSYPAGKPDESYTIPADVTEIASGAFDGAAKLKSISMGDNVTTLGVMTFRNCTALKDVKLPSGLGYLPSGTFSGCKSLENIRLPENYTYIGTSAFEGCSSLPEITLPEQIKIIGQAAFSECKNLKEIVVPAQVDTIRAYTFSGCSSLTKITLPDGVTRIGRGALQGCGSLAEIALPSGLKTIEDRAFKDCVALTEVRIPNSTTEIGTAAFEGCASMLHMDTGDGVTSLGNWAFYECVAMESISLGKSLTEIGTQAFDGDNNISSIECRSEVPPVYPTGFAPEVLANAELKVPEGSEDDYNSNPTWQPLIDKSDIDNIWTGNDTEIRVSGNTLSITAPDKAIDVYSIAGVNIIHAISEISLTLERGIYIVRIGTESMKVKI